MHLAGQGNIRRKPMFGSDARVDNEYRLNIRSLSTSKYKAMLLLFVSGAVGAVAGAVDVKLAEYTTCSALAVSATVRNNGSQRQSVSEKQLLGNNSAARQPIQL